MHVSAPAAPVPASVQYDVRACMRPCILAGPGVSFHMVCGMACAASAPHCRTACMPAGGTTTAPPLAACWFVKSRHTLTGQEPGLCCYNALLPPRTHAACSACSSLARLAVARSQPSTDHTGMQMQHARPARAQLHAHAPAPAGEAG